MWIVTEKLTDIENARNNQVENPNPGAMNPRLLKRAFNRIPMHETTPTSPPSRRTPSECQAACETFSPSTTSSGKANPKADLADRPVTQPVCQKNPPSCLIDGQSVVRLFCVPRCRKKFKAFIEERKWTVNNSTDHLGKRFSNQISKIWKQNRKGADAKRRGKDTSPIGHFGMKTEKM